MQIRPGQDQDRDAVRALWDQAGLTRVSEEEWRALVRADCAALLVATEDNGSLIGAAVFAFDGWRAFVYHVAVAPAYRRAGVGTSLIQQAEERVRGKGARRIFALVHESMTDGLALCAATGYEPEGDLVLVKGLMG